ncbi:hypothetical protein A3Q56_05823 [Intoshia linei]|uniref:Large ribosomal subunit protein uL10 n=1 Tax=Intoshia linei TaxID=1819745 RepID=A0A177AWT0_9BILA|nr:hypothetical protein A3Q56_05823 [Intoshia linei]
MEAKKQLRKQRFFEKVTNLFSSYGTIIIVDITHVSAVQMQATRRGLSKHLNVNEKNTAELLCGKNSLIAKAISLMDIPDLVNLVPHIKNNVALVFTSGDVKSVIDKCTENKVPAAAKVGSIAPIDVVLPKQATTISPNHTAFFQNLRVNTKITKGCIEIMEDFNIIKKGAIIGANEVALLKMMDICPFTYGIVPISVYDTGYVYDHSVYYVTEEEYEAKIQSGLKNICAVSLAIDHPTAVSVPYSIVSAFKNVLAVALETGIDIKEVKEIKDYLDNPDKYAVAAPVQATAVAEVTKTEVVEEEESDEDMGFGLFD